MIIYVENHKECTNWLLGLKSKFIRSQYIRSRHNNLRNSCISMYQQHVTGMNYFRKKYFQWHKKHKILRNKLNKRYARPLHWKLQNIIRLI